jgi:hypothetical protein
MASAAGAIAILGEIASLEPIAFNLVAELVHGLQGKSDAQVLAADSTSLAAIITTAHQEAKGAQ